VNRPTWEYLAEREPRLAALDRIVEIACANIRDDDPHWCANVFWAQTVKPLMDGLVGWHRGRAVDNAPDPDVAADGVHQWTGVDVLLSIVDTERWTRPAETHAEEALRSSAAYELVLNRLYERLPDCRDCGCPILSRSAGRRR